MVPKLQKRMNAIVPSPQHRSEIPDTTSEFSSLTPREYEIAKHVAMGFSNKEVARVFDISHWTVAAHLKSTFLKLEVRRRSELAYLMRRIL